MSVYLDHKKLVFAVCILIILCKIAPVKGADCLQGEHSFIEALDRVLAKLPKMPKIGN